MPLGQHHITAPQFDFHHMAGSGPHALHGGGDPAGQRNVVVLD